MGALKGGGATGEKRTVRNSLAGSGGGGAGEFWPGGACTTRPPERSSLTLPHHARYACLARQGSFPGHGMSQYARLADVRWCRVQDGDRSGLKSLAPANIGGNAPGAQRPRSPAPAKARIRPAPGRACVVVHVVGEVPRVDRLAPHRMRGFAGSRRGGGVPSLRAHRLTPSVVMATRIRSRGRITGHSRLAPPRMLRCPALARVSAHSPAGACRMSH